MFGIVKDAIDHFRQLIIPRQYFAWQTLLLLSLFSWLTAFIASSLQTAAVTVHVLVSASWLFLGIAIWWALVENPVKLFSLNLSAWITGIVFCIFLFNPWNHERLSWALASWPVISTVIAAVPNFIRWDLTWYLPKASVRQGLLLMLMINLLLSSWIMFYFRVQHWLTQYPSLLVDDLNQSTFVYEFKTGQSRFSQGVPLLDNAAESLSQQLNGVPWPRVERWLLNIDDGIEDLARNIRISAPDESVFWSLDAPRPEESGGGYTLRLRANWLGPTSQHNGYYLEKVCQIMPTRQAGQTRPSPIPGQSASVEQDLTPIAQVECNLETSPLQWKQAVES
jgi:hypothetical protein